MVNKFDMQTLMVAWGKLVFDHCSPGHQKIGACTVSVLHGFGCRLLIQTAVLFADQYAPVDDAEELA